MKKSIFSFIVILTLILPLSAKATDDARLLRFTDINDNLIAFVYAGDIWTVNSTGGEARRLTSHEGLELFPKISPDGQWIAFSGEYSWNRQVFVMPANGGVPRQLTWYNSASLRSTVNSVTGNGTREEEPPTSGYITLRKIHQSRSQISKALTRFRPGRATISSSPLTAT